MSGLGDQDTDLKCGFDEFIHSNFPPRPTPSKVSKYLQMGIVFSFLNEGLPPKSKFNVENIPDLTGKVIIVTGANTGAIEAIFI